MNDAPQLLDLRTEPFEFLGRDAIMFRVARLHIGVLELLEHCALRTRVTGPDVEQAIVQTFSLRAEES